MGRCIELNPDGAGPIPAWRADPAGSPRAGIVVIQEIFGVNAHIRAVAYRFAAEGYLVVAGRRHGEKLAPLAAEIAASGGRCVARSLDARQEDQVAAFIAEAFLPEGFCTTVMRESPAASCQAIPSVWSREGPTARTSSNPPS